MLINRNISLLLIIVISILLFVPQMFGIGLNNDELASMTFATSGQSGAIFWDNTPPLYYFLLKAWFVFFPDTPNFARLMNLLLATLVPLLGYLTAEKLFGEKSAVWAGILFLFSAIHLRYSFEIRSYVLFEVLCITNIFYFLKSFETKKLSVYYGVSSVALVLTHYLAIVWFVAQVVVFTLSEVKVRHRYWVYFFTLLIGIVVAGEINLASLNHLNVNSEDWQNLGSHFSKNAINYLSMLFIVFLMALFRDRKYQNLDRLFSSILLILISIFVVTSKTLFLEKYFIFLIPILLLRLSDVLSNIDKKLAYGIVGIYLSLNIVRIINQFGRLHSGWSEVIQSYQFDASSVVFTDANLIFEKFYDLNNAQIKNIALYKETDLSQFKNVMFVTKSIEPQEDVLAFLNGNTEFQLLSSKRVGESTYEPLVTTVYQRVDH